MKIDTKRDHFLVNMYFLTLTAGQFRKKVKENLSLIEFAKIVKCDYFLGWFFDWIQG